MNDVKISDKAQQRIFENRLLTYQKIIVSTLQEEHLTEEQIRSLLIDLDVLRHTLQLSRVIGGDYRG